MQSDNNQEMFPIVDEQGTITGAATRGECHSGRSYCIRLSICTYSTQKVNFTCRSALNGKIYSRANGILP